MPDAPSIGRPRFRTLPPGGQPGASWGLFYQAFEGEFRGSREEIKDRLSVYLPLLPTSRRPVLDLGCGRGEWLELLRDNAVPALGIDSSAQAIDECKARNLEGASRGSAVDDLLRWVPGDLGAVTAFHLIEHLGYPDQLALITGAQAALAPGGVLIVETPDWRKAQMNFWRDPSHVAPVHPDTLAFMLAWAGLIDVEVWSFARGDFAVIGRKPQ